MTTVAEFAEKARAYIEWAEQTKPSSPDEDTREVLGLLVGLYAAAINLPEGEGADDERDGTSREEWAGVYSRCGNLPFDFYWEMFDPLSAEAEEPVGGSLGDDLADIHRDLKRGMSYFAEGNEPAAAWEWQFHFRAHWGHHATAAIYALHAWWADKQLSQPGI